MRNLKLKDVSEMVITYMQDHQVDLLTAYNTVNDVLKDANIFDFNTIKTYIFRHPEIQKP
jgi:hypothetical protein